MALCNQSNGDKSNGDESNVSLLDVVTHSIVLLMTLSVCISQLWSGGSVYLTLFCCLSLNISLLGALLSPSPSLSPSSAPDTRAFLFLLTILAWFTEYWVPASISWYPLVLLSSSATYSVRYNIKLNISITYKVKSACARVLCCHDDISAILFKVWP